MLVTNIVICSKLISEFLFHVHDIEVCLQWWYAIRDKGILSAGWALKIQIRLIIERVLCFIYDGYSKRRVVKTQANNREIFYGNTQ